jgi:Domain of unknown function (DUF4389)
MTDQPPPANPPPAATPPPTPPAPPPTPPPTPAGSPSSYPINLGFERDLDVQNWRPLVNWLLAIPHLIVLYGLGIASGVLWLISFFTILFTKKNPFLGFQAMVLRYQWRVFSYVYWLRNEYPPFEFKTTPLDDNTDPARVDVEDPVEMNRWLVLVKWLLAIPQYIVLIFLGIALWVVLVITFFAVLFTGKWPEGMRTFAVGVTRWSTRVSGYVLFLTDEYPPFSLE